MSEIKMKVYIVLTTFNSSNFINNTQIEGVFKDKKDAENMIIDLHDYYLYSDDMKDYHLSLNPEYNNTTSFIHLDDDLESPETWVEIEFIEKEVQ